MANLHELIHPISDITFKVLRGDPRKPLESLQGNILQGHGRDRSVHILLRFNKGKRAAVKRWIMRLADEITSAQQQHAEIQQYRQRKRSGDLFRSFFLSASGYTYLGLALPQNKPSFDDEGKKRYLTWLSDRYNGDVTTLNRRYCLSVQSFAELKPDEHWLRPEELNWVGCARPTKADFEHRTPDFYRWIDNQGHAQGVDDGTPFGTLALRLTR